MLGSVLFALLTWGISISFAHDKLSTTHLMDVLFFNGSGGAGFPILPLLSYGIIGFGLGMAWNKYKLDLTVWTVLVTASFFFLLKLLNIFITIGPIHLFRSTFMGIARFSILLLLGITICKSRTTNKALAFLRIIGESGLLCFITHRAILHGLVLVNQTTMPSTSEELQYCAYFVATLAILILLCGSRAHFPAWDKFLKKLYL
jgi:hypothetical protein